MGRLPRVLGAAVGVGVVVGLLVAVFEQIVVEVMLERLFHLPLWQQALAPLVGLSAAAVLLHVVGGRGTTPSTSDEYIRAFHERSPRMPLRQLPAKLLAGAATIGSGGALGMEGPSIFAGASVAHNLQRLLQRFLRREEMQMLLTAGAAAGVAAIFRAPATGVIFALEAPYRDDVTRRALLPSLVASAVSFLLFAVVLGDTTPVFGGLGGDLRTLAVVDLLGGALVGVTAGLGGRGFSALVRWAKALPRRVGRIPRILAAGTLLCGLAFATNALFGAPLSLGPGVRSAEWVLDVPRGVWLIVALFGLRLVATLGTLVGGGTGGLFIPLAVQGVLMGTIVGVLLNQTDTGLYPTLGLAAFLGAGYRAPIAAVMFVAESSQGSSFVVPALVAAAVAQLVAGRASVSAHQAAERLGHLEKRFMLPITSVLRTDVLTVPPDATISELMDDARARASRAGSGRRGGPSLSRHVRPGSDRRPPPQRVGIDFRRPTWSPATFPRRSRRGTLRDGGGCDGSGPMSRCLRWSRPMARSRRSRARGRHPETRDEILEETGGLTAGAGIRPVTNSLRRPPRRRCPAHHER